MFFHNFSIKLLIIIIYGGAIVDYRAKYGRPDMIGSMAITVMVELPRVLGTT